MEALQSSHVGTFPPTHSLSPSVIYIIYINFYK